MTGQTQPALAQAPERVTAEMPPGYETRLWKVQRLTAELQAMDRIGRVLWETGDPLRETVGELFRALKCEVDAAPGAGRPITVNLGDSRRLLLFVSGAASPVQKANEELARTFQIVQVAAPDDRVVFVANNDPATPPAGRPDPCVPDALRVLQRMGVDVVTTAALFMLWRLSLDDRQKARKVRDRLHSQDGGLFVMPSR